MIEDRRTLHMARMSQKLNKDIVKIYENSLKNLPYVIECVLTNEADRKAAGDWMDVLKRAKQNNWRFDQREGSMDLDWLKEHCGEPDSYQGRLSLPFTASDSAGRKWRCATDGHHMIVVTIADDTEYPMGHADVPDVKPYLNATFISCWTGALKNFRRMIGEIPVMACDNCHGTGKAKCSDCRGLGHYEYPDPPDDLETVEDAPVVQCDECAGTGIEKCSLCRGTGHVTHHHKRAIIIGDQYFNANLIAFALRHWNDTEAIKIGFWEWSRRTIFKDRRGTPLIIEAVERRAYIMPLNSDYAREWADAPQVL